MSDKVRRRLIVIGLILAVGMCAVPFTQNVREHGWPWAPRFDDPTPEPSRCVIDTDGVTRLCIGPDGNPTPMP